MMAVGRDADPAVAEFIYELFTADPAREPRRLGPHAGRSLGTHKHIGLQNLTVPTLVIGSEKDRLLPMVSSRHIARMAPNLAQFVELSGGHCAILERPDEVNAHLRWLVESVSEPQRATSPSPTVRCAPRRPRDAPTGRRRRGTRSIGRRFRCLPRRCGPRACVATARRWSRNPAVPPRSARPARNPLSPNSGRRSRSAPAPRRRTGRRTPPARARGARAGGSESNVRGSVKPNRMPGPSSPGLTSNVMNTGPSSDSASPLHPFARQNGVS